MPDSITVFSNRLNQLDPFDKVNFLGDLEELLTQSSAETLRMAHKTIFQFFEDYPETQLLGPFLHVLDDHYPDYLEELVESVDRKPSTSTLLMVNRHLNEGHDDATRDRLMTCLLTASQQGAVSQMIRDEAAGYFERQNHLKWDDLRLPIDDRKAPDDVLLAHSIKELQGRYVILRGYLAPSSVMQVQERRFGLVAEDAYGKLSSTGSDSIPMHLLVAVNLPKYLKATTRESAIVVEGILSLDVERTTDGAVTTVYSVMAKCIIIPGD